MIEQGFTEGDNNARGLIEREIEGICLGETPLVRIRLVDLAEATFSYLSWTQIVPLQERLRKLVQAAENAQNVGVSTTQMEVARMVGVKTAITALADEMKDARLDSLRIKGS